MKKLYTDPIMEVYEIQKNDILTNSDLPELGSEEVELIFY